MRKNKKWLYIYMSSKSEEEKINHFDSIIEENEKKAKSIRSDIPDMVNNIEISKKKKQEPLAKKTELEKILKMDIDRLNGYRVKQFDDRMSIEDLRDEYNLNQNINELRRLIRKRDTQIGDIEKEISNFKKTLDNKNMELNELGKTIENASDEKKR